MRFAKDANPRPTDELATGIRALLASMALDPELFEPLSNIIGTITPIQRILGRPDVQERLAAVRPVSRAPRRRRHCPGLTAHSCWNW